MSAKAERAPRVAILGANGQVGTELCLYLHLGGFAQPVAVARSEYSLAILRRLGIESRVAAGDMRGAIDDCDAVFDLVHPWQTDTKAMRNAIERRAAQIFEAARPAAPIIYVSTMSVFGLDPGRPGYTIYRATKRFAERLYL